MSTPKVSIYIGACVPATCSLENLTAIFDHFDKNITVDCLEQESEWRSGDSFAM